MAHSTTPSMTTPPPAPRLSPATRARRMAEINDLFESMQLNTGSPARAASPPSSALAPAQTAGVVERRDATASPPPPSEGYDEKGMALIAQMAEGYVAGGLPGLEYLVQSLEAIHAADPRTRYYAAVNRLQQGDPEGVADEIVAAMDADGGAYHFPSAIDQLRRANEATSAALAQSCIEAGRQEERDGHLGIAEDMYDLAIMSDEKAGLFARADFFLRQHKDVVHARVDLARLRELGDGSDPVRRLEARAALLELDQGRVPAARRAGSAASLRGACTDLLAAYPDDPELLYLRAAACMAMNLAFSAGQDVATLERFHPSSGYVRDARARYQRFAAASSAATRPPRWPAPTPVGVPASTYRPLGADMPPVSSTTRSAPRTSVVYDSAYYNAQHFNRMASNIRHNNWAREDARRDFNRSMDRR